LQLSAQIAQGERNRALGQVRAHEAGIRAAEVWRDRLKLRQQGSEPGLSGVLRRQQQELREWRDELQEARNGWYFRYGAHVAYSHALRRFEAALQQPTREPTDASQPLRRD